MKGKLEIAHMLFGFETGFRCQEAELNSVHSSDNYSSADGSINPIRALLSYGCGVIANLSRKQASRRGVV